MPDVPPGRSDSGPAPEPGPASQGSAPPPGTSSEGAADPGSPDSGAEASSASGAGTRPTEDSAADARSRRRRRGSRGGRGRSPRRTVAGDEPDDRAGPGGQPESGAGPGGQPESGAAGRKTGLARPAGWSDRRRSGHGGRAGRVRCHRPGDGERNAAGWRDRTHDAARCRPRQPPPEDRRYPAGAAAGPDQGARREAEGAGWRRFATERREGDRRSGRPARRDRRPGRSAR